MSRLELRDDVRPTDRPRAGLVKTRLSRRERFGPGQDPLVCLALILALGQCLAAEPGPDPADFFEQNVRPIFAEHCYECHSAKSLKVKGGLRLDTADGLARGGSSGPAFVAGNPDASLLIKAVRYTDPDLQMPPKDRKLAPEKIAVLENWIKSGAPLPHNEGTAMAATNSVAEIRARHWAFQPVKKPVVPAVKLQRWLRTPVDNFVLAALEKRGLTPAPAADRRALIRRVCYDLTGLPPSWTEVDNFVHDARPDAYAQLVDRLLASPHYGERWGRYWLDVARYADTKGYLAGGEERRYAFSFTYRDYVVRAFNEDKPYDRFLLEQIAADRVPGEDSRNLAALGFLTLGRRFLNNQNDIIDDRIDVVTRGTLGLTVACARCHDHKFDPIPSKDYYALHGVFASSEEPGELPLLGDLKPSPDYDDYLRQKAKIQAEMEEFRAGEINKFMSELRRQVGDYLLGAHAAESLDDPAKFETFAGERKLNHAILRRWMNDLEPRRKTHDPIFTPWFELARLGETNFAAQAPAALAKLASDNTVNVAVRAALIQSGTNSLKAAAEAYTKLFQSVDDDWKTVLENAAKAKTNAPAALPDPAREALRQVLFAEGTAVNLPRSEAENIVARRLTEGSAPFRNRIEALSWTHPGAPRRAMAMVDRANPGNSHVLLRGNPGTPGEEAPRRFLDILSPASRAPFTNGSGRFELARAIISPQNPLTARVFANRVWLHHFGEGLVRTPGDFGVRTEEPVHHGLLDYLAASLMEGNWSIKRLHRLIVLSAAYQQSSDAPAASTRADPDNRLITRMNRQRLDFEALRDTLLAVAGHLDPAVGGLPMDLETQPFTTRRTIYGLIDRQNLPGVLRTFDFANPDTSSQVRFHTTVPQQALFLMNSPFVIEQARLLASRPEVVRAENAGDKIRALYRITLQRDPTVSETELGRQFLDGRSNNSQLKPLVEYAQILLLSNELMFID